MEQEEFVKMFEDGVVTISAKTIHDYYSDSKEMEISLSVNGKVVSTDTVWL